MSAIENQQVAELFEQIADFLEIKGENFFKVKAYQRAARAIEGLDRNVSDLRKAGELKDVPGIGKAIEEKIGEFLDDGHIKLHQQLCTEFPPAMLDLMNVPGLGAKKAAALFNELGVGSLPELEEALKDGRVAPLKGFGKKTEAKLLDGLTRLRAQGAQTRTLLGVAHKVAHDVIDHLSQIEGVERLTAAGSLRRACETVGDLDIVCLARNSRPVMDAFCALVGPERVLLRGDTKSSVRWAGELQIDLRVVAPESYGAAMQYFTGSKDHNVKLRVRAEKMGLKLNEYGLLDILGQPVAQRTEEEIYEALGLAWIPPELREGNLEIEAAERRELPRLLEIGDLRGNLHTHSTWSDGAQALEELAREAVERGHRYLGITDHSRSLVIANGLTVERLREQRLAIDRLNETLGDHLRLLAGTECDILGDGRLDYADEELARLDFVVASVHSQFNQSKEDMTRRLLRALENPHVDIIGHPSGRRLGHRPGYDADWDEIFKTAARLGKALEINSSPNRLDLSDKLARRARELGCLLSVNTDAHSLAEFDFVDLGVGVARRAWLEPQHVLNTRDLEALLAWRKARFS